MQRVLGQRRLQPVRHQGGHGSWPGPPQRCSTASEQPHPGRASSARPGGPRVSGERAEQRVLRVVMEPAGLVAECPQAVREREERPDDRRGRVGEVGGHLGRAEQLGCGRPGRPGPRYPAGSRNSATGNALLGGPATTVGVATAPIDDPRSAHRILTRCACRPRSTRCPGVAPGNQPVEPRAGPAIEPPPRTRRRRTGTASPPGLPARKWPVKRPVLTRAR